MFGLVIYIYPLWLIGLDPDRFDITDRDYSVNDFDYFLPLLIVELNISLLPIASCLLHWLLHIAFCLLAFAYAHAMGLGDAPPHVLGPLSPPPPQAPLRSPMVRRPPHIGWGMDPAKCTGTGIGKCN